MTACEKCWADAYLDSLMFAVSQVERYRQLLVQRADEHEDVDPNYSPGQPGARSSP